MKNQKLKDKIDWVVIIILAVSFIYFALNLNNLEPWLYEVFNIKLGNIITLDIKHLTGQFLQVAFLACVSSLVLGLLIGIFCLTSLGKEFRPVIEKIATVLRACPELALIRFMVPILGLGVVPTVVALTTHGVLPIKFATIAGVENIDPTFIKVAKGMGMSDKEIMVKIQLPMAVPVIVSGLRVSLISCIGGATLANASGAEGLGVLLSVGMQSYNTVLIMECALLICLLSLLTDKTLLKLENMLTNNTKYSYK